MANKRIWYGVKQVGIAKDGLNTFTAIHGLQSIGVNKNLNLDIQLEMGQGAVYEAKEQIPDIEISVEKKIDGYPLIYHLMTQGAPTATLVGRCGDIKCIIGVSVFPDTNDSASGTPLAQQTMSGQYVNSLNYKFPVQGQCTETVTSVGNTAVWNNSFTATTFNNLDSPPASGGIQIRENVLMGSGKSKFPAAIPGIGSDNYINQSDDTRAPLQSVTVSVNLAREQLFELGKRIAYCRYVNWPVDVRTEIETIAKTGDGITLGENAAAQPDEPIRVWLKDGSKFDMGTRNKFSTCNEAGANAAQNGGNVTLTYVYLNKNTLTVTAPYDPDTNLAQ